MNGADPAEVSYIRAADVKPASVYRRVRLLLDAILILLVILIASGNRLPARAGTSSQAALVGQSGPSGAPMTASANAQPASVLIDNATLAAVIAAENAALTPPLYFSDLPLIRH